MKTVINGSNTNTCNGKKSSFNVEDYLGIASLKM